MHVIHRFFLTLACSMFVASSALAQSPVEVGGAKFEASAQVANTKLQLNGAGVRYKIVFKVYAVGLYLPTKAATVDAVVNSSVPRRVQVTMLRDIDAREFGKMASRAMEDNVTKEHFAKSINGILRLGEMFAIQKQLKTGESFTVDWLPGTGTVITINGKSQPPIKEPEFFASLLNIWLGHKPVDPLLKDALLGKAPSTAREF